MNGPAVAGNLFKSCPSLTIERGLFILGSPAPDIQKLLNKCLLNLHFSVYLLALVHMGVQYMFICFLILTIIFKLTFIFQ